MLPELFPYACPGCGHVGGCFVKKHPLEDGRMICKKCGSDVRERQLPIVPIRVPVPANNPGTSQEDR
jgi:transcription elongation factor Elf1